MRYSIMLQLVAATTIVLLGAAALFAWLQNRTEPGTVQPARVSTRAL